MCEKCANNDTDSPIIMIQPWRGGAVYLSIQLGHQCHGNMNHGFRHWYKPLMWHWMGPQPPSPGRSPQRFYMYSCKANSYRRPKYMQPEETTDKYSNHQSLNERHSLPVPSILKTANRLGENPGSLSTLIVAIQ
jgi:hypothetical protein